jgi:hypothetical protein
VGFDDTADKKTPVRRRQTRSCCLFHTPVYLSVADVRMETAGRTCIFMFWSVGLGFGGDGRLGVVIWFSDSLWLLVNPGAVCLEKQTASSLEFFSFGPDVKYLDQGLLPCY